MAELVDATVKLLDNVGDLTVERTQVISDRFKENLKREQDNFKWRLDGFTKVASIPQAMADKWLREGFDVFKAPAQDIIRRLQLEGLDLFITAGNRTI